MTPDASIRELACTPEGSPRSILRLGCGAARELGSSRDGRTLFALVDRAILAARPDIVPAGARRLAVAGGEASKTFAGLELVLREMAQANLDRRTLFAAIGGGSIGDLGGLAASLWQRGIDLVQVPTTLLAMVDSSVGGKTAINIPEGKNLIGSFWPAATVLLDPELLTSLPETEFRSGLGEVVKMAIGLDSELFEFLERDREAVMARELDALTRAIELSVAAKIRVVEGDPREAGPRRVLNLGHTIGHALEAHENFAIPHGVAVARGIDYAIDLAEQLGRIAAADADRCRALLRAYGFDKTEIPDEASLQPFLARDKKIQDGVLHWVLPTGIGSCAQHAIPAPS